MHTETLMMLIPTLQVAIAATAIALSGYLMCSRLFAHMGRRFGN